ncbi:Putative large multi-functional protein OS=Blastopirellula marina DSM 3645 GN=DSM3645_20562 PE=4 SV=1: DUF1080 [Gemmataceae bacterium]|nr:Putative large multi-functional protein OS=Blastopirellula marina DSM 3645 GN=DSM3645_20562 PE=4 SV=1: DUF1080 [Gemmataceae bacterium]VTU00105.1 Putative large multi-functional protein OS=Blastopirellula marina DSM 3645 GN=DSM3645_20562 PE=4 SV=1: DUF1080 [Gemmataceae bacterium]
MFRTLLCGALAAGLVAGAALPGRTQDAKKTDAPKKKERIALNEPTEVAKDKDYAVQGEYVAELSNNQDKYKLGVQVIARGMGEFEVKVLKGGLPGDGWDRKTTMKAAAKRGDDGTVAITGKDIEGTIAGDKSRIRVGGDEGALTRVERKSPTLGKQPPEGAVVLFAKEGDEKNWDGGKLVKLSDGTFLNMGVKSKEKFQAFTAHIEFRLPWMPHSLGQGRGNSGVYFQDRYECQVLDSFGLSGENNECGGIYTQHKPKENMCLPPMVWQTYDIDFTPAQFDADGKKTKNGRLTLVHNGVVVQDNVEFPKECPGGQKEAPTPGPFQFQNHGDPVVYRNVWVVPVK